VLECVVNVSEGRDQGILDQLRAACRGDLLDLHTDPHHHRSVFTLVGTEAPRRLTRAAVALLDLSEHRGVHPRIGVVDVVPFVPLGTAPMSRAIAARDAFSRWAARELGLPCFRYGPERTLPQVRRGAFTTLEPDDGPPVPHPTAGATAVGARPPLVAYNIWLKDADLPTAQEIASRVRSPGIRALGLDVGGRMQVSMNLVDPLECGPGTAAAVVTAAASDIGTDVEGAELVGLLPQAVLELTPPERWAALGLDPDRTIEARLREAESGRRRA
jgi:glutamate formiminotransferase